MNADLPVEGVEQAIQDLEAFVPFLSVEDAARLSVAQVRLGELVLQIVETEKARRDLDSIGSAS